MKKYTIVANISYEVNNVKHIEMNVHWVEGKNMHDALHNHWQQMIDSYYEVEDAVIFEGEHSYKETHDFIDINAQKIELV